MMEGMTMKLDRNIEGNQGRRKYALLHLRRLNGLRGSGGVLPPRLATAINSLIDAGIIEYGATPEDEFFVIKLKDKYAQAALFTYANDARADNEGEYGQEVTNLAMRAGPSHPLCKKPD